jgi:hypothetical protein
MGKIGDGPNRGVHSVDTRYPGCNHLIVKSIAGQPHFKNRRLPSYPIGLLVRIRMVSGREIDAQITRIETTALGTYLNVEFDDEVASVTAKQIIGFYDFCRFNGRRGEQYVR